MGAREKFFAKGFDARGFVDIFLAAEAKSAVGRDFRGIGVLTLKSKQGLKRRRSEAVGGTKRKAPK